MVTRNDKPKAPTRRKPTPRKAGGKARSGTQPSSTPQGAQAPSEEGPSRNTPPLAAAQAGAAGLRPRAQRPAAPQRPARERTDSTEGAAGAFAARLPSKRPRRLLAVLAAAVVVLALLGLANSYCQADNNRVKLCEQWRSTVKHACIDCNLDDQWTDAILALMAIESGGDVDVKSVEGVENDIMQAAEGKYGKIVKSGSAKYGVQAQTPEASIYAGVLEFKQNYKLWKKYLNGIGVSETGEIQLVVQGYNFGADGWCSWCKEHNVTTYTVETAQEYSDTVMPEDAKGTPTHGEKWLAFYEMIRG